MEKALKLLIVDDELANLQKLKRTFVDFFEVYQADSARDALDLVRQQVFAVVITDQRMPGMTGVELLRDMLQLSPNTVRIILTGYTDVEALIDAINQGHVDRYVTKPWEPDSLRRVVEREVERWKLRQENEHLSRHLKVANKRLENENVQLRQEVQWLQDSEKKMIYKSRSMHELLELVDRVVSTDSTVLIQGETGTGKELLARYIHENSLRQEQSFVSVNCAAIPTDLMESAFFGHKKGAFTGATEDKKGYFELANEGSLFLDEIGESSVELQVKLLRVLQEGEIFPLGAQKARKVDVRLIASTNRSLTKEVEAGNFRQDLFFRLNVFSVFVPPLRLRIGDIEALSAFFLERFQERLAKQVLGFEVETMELLKRYSWPGNVRELENEIERMSILCEPGQKLSVPMLSERVRWPDERLHSRGLLKEKLGDLEQRLILDALKDHDYNKSQAAQALGITRQTIISKLKKYKNS